MKRMSYLVIAMLTVMSGNVFATSDLSLTELTESEMSVETGQALFSLSYLAPGQAGNPTANTATNTGFYTLGMEAELNLNANIKNLQLGCGGANGAGGCDIDAQNVSFGCVANSAGVCTSLAPVTQPNGVTQIAGAVSDAPGNQQQLKDFVLTNPFVQLAIRNPNSASTREVVGVRLGAAQAEGPLSFGQLNTFSGYLSGRTNLTMQGQGPGRGNLAANAEDVAVTCKAPQNCATAAGRSDYTGMADYRYLGLDNAEECILIVACAQFKQLTISFTSVNRTNLATVASGNRQTQAFVSGANLGTGTHGGQAGVVKAITDSMEIERTTSIFGEGLLNAILGAIRASAATKITNQLAAGLGTTAAALNNNTYQLPFNIANVHQLNIDSDAFGLSLQKEALQYPGYVAPVTAGWALYAPESFGLTIARRTTEFVQGIVSSADARNGNIVGLEPSFRNCYGTLTFC